LKKTQRPLVSLKRLFTGASSMQRGLQPFGRMFSKTHMADAVSSIDSVSSKGLALKVVLEFDICVI
jgi:hypothetical protein